MQTRDAMRYTAFTRDPTGGNPAGVVIADAPMPEGDMQGVAADIGFSETAFVSPAGGGADYDIRYFSPEREVSFCGHATIATAVALAERDPALDRVVFATRSDLVPVRIERTPEGVTATLTSPPSTHRAVEDGVLDEALAAFGWGHDVLAEDLPPVVASAGAHHLILPVTDRSTLQAMAYDFDALREVMLREGWTTVDVIWRERPDRFHARNPFPVGGVVEDPATGAAAAALGGYLRDAGLVTPPVDLTVVQGEDMGRPSRLHVHIGRNEPGIDVGGAAVRMP